MNHIEHRTEPPLAHKKPNHLKCHFPLAGLYDLASEGNFRWIDCSEMNAWQNTNWASGQPDDTDGTQDCGQMISSGEWMDWPCDRPNQYICEVNPISRFTYAFSTIYSVSHKERYPFSWQYNLMTENIFFKHLYIIENLNLSSFV